MPVDGVPAALIRLVTRYRAERRGDEAFHVWARRTPSDDLVSTLSGAPAEVGA